MRAPCWAMRSPGGHGLCARDYRAALGQMAGMRFDLVFLDPPYRMAEAYGDALSRLLAMAPSARAAGS